MWTLVQLTYICLSLATDKWSTDKYPTCQGYCSLYGKILLYLHWNKHIDEDRLWCNEWEGMVSGKHMPSQFDLQTGCPASIVATKQRLVCIFSCRATLYLVLSVCLFVCNSCSIRGCFYHYLIFVLKNNFPYPKSRFSLQKNLQTW